jgi:hypothetical protein
MVSWGLAPKPPGFTATLPSQKPNSRGEQVAPSWSGPLSALELRPRIALSSAKASHSVANQELIAVRSVLLSVKVTFMTSVTFLAEATR